MDDAYLKKLSANWDEEARRDAAHAVLSDPSRLGQRWDDAEFFHTGQREVQTVLDHLRSLGLRHEGFASALDFGCGLGRLTQALSQHAGQATGADISAVMVEKARALAAARTNCRFVVNVNEDLSQFADRSFDLIYSSITLQHVHPRVSVKYLAEFGRVLAPGGIAVFQLPDGSAASPWKRLRFQLRNNYRLRRWLAKLGLAHGGSFHELHTVPESTVRGIFAAPDFEVKSLRYTNSLTDSFNGQLALAEQPGPGNNGVQSKQYVVAKRQA